MPLLAVLTVAAFPVQLLLIWLWIPGARKLARAWHCLALAIVGVRIRVHGKPPSARPLLIAANHISWTDVLVLGSVMEVCFIAKSEVRSWTGVNVLALLQRTVFVDRDSRRSAQQQVGAIASRLGAGDAVVLFAEGTTGDGHRIGTFKSTLFGGAKAAILQTRFEQVVIQPVALCYTGLHGLPLGRFHRARIAWPGDVAFAPHLRSFVMAGAYQVDVVFCRSFQVLPDSDRKAVAERCAEEVRRAYVQMLHGRTADAQRLDRD